MLLLVFPVTMGVGLAIQTAVNSKLRTFVLSPYLSSGFSFLIAWLFLMILSLLTHQQLLISYTTLSQEPMWLWLGGLFGAIALTGNVVLFQKIGSLQTTVLPIMGQIAMSIVIDQFGLFNSPQNQISFSRIIGLILLISGVILSLGILDNNVEGVIKEEENELNREHINVFYQIFAVVSGMLMAVQTAINGYLGKVLSSPIHASFISFTIGIICLILINLILKTKIMNLKNAIKQGISYWWIWIGGVLGALYILCSSWLVPVIGTGQVVVLALFGQLLFSALIEHLGLFESVRNKITRSKVIGLSIMFVGVIFIKFMNF